MDIGLAADLPAERFIDRLHLPAAELRQHIEHAGARHHRQFARLLQGGDQHSGKGIKLTLAGIVDEIRHRHRNAHSLTRSVRLRRPGAGKVKQQRGQRHDSSGDPGQQAFPGNRRARCGCSRRHILCNRRRGYPFGARFGAVQVTQDFRK